jgi:hypothetical protein
MRSSIILLTFLFAGCATKMTVPPFSTNSENVWFLEQNVSDQIARPMFCMADVKDGAAHPKCYRSKVIPAP